MCCHRWHHNRVAREVHVGRRRGAREDLDKVADLRALGRLRRDRGRGGGRGGVRRRRRLGGGRVRDRVGRDGGLRGLGRRRPRAEHGEGGGDGMGMECVKVEGDGSGRII